MQSYEFSQVDVFAGAPHRGNPVAVVHGADALSDDEMAAFARWTNLSETTFLLQPQHPDADYALRIFTPGGELPFAGHPTLGSCHAWLERGAEPKRPGNLVQECAVGLVTVRQQGAELAFAAPPLRRSGPMAPEEVQALLSPLGLGADDVVDHQWVDNGPGWCALLLPSAERVLDVRPRLADLGDQCVGLVGPQDPAADTDFEVRAFVPSLGVPEDPVTGSLNASIGQWLIGAGIAPSRYLAAQGTAIGRCGRVSVAREGDSVWVGGATQTVIRGSVDF